MAFDLLTVAFLECQNSWAPGLLTRIEWELASYLATPRARKLLAFTRYLERRRGRAPSTARQIHARASRPIADL